MIYTKLLNYAFARILGPLTGGIVWTLTASRDWPFDYHTVFHICGLVMLLASVLALRLPTMDIDQPSSFGTQEES